MRDEDSSFRYPDPRPAWLSASRLKLAVALVLLLTDCPAERFASLDLSGLYRAWPERAGAGKITEPAGSR